MAGRRNRSRGWRRPAVVLARSSAYLPSILASNAVSVRGLRGLATPTLWGAALRQRCDRNVQRPRLNLLLEHEHPPECVARALLSVPPCPPALISLETSDPALSQLAWAHLKAVGVSRPAGAFLPARCTAARTGIQTSHRSFHSGCRSFAAIRYQFEQVAMNVG